MDGRKENKDMARGQGSLVKADFGFGWKGEITRLIERTGDLLLERDARTVLDVGCGTCELAKYLRGKG